MVRQTDTSAGMFFAPFPLLTLADFWPSFKQGLIRAREEKWAARQDEATVRGRQALLQRGASSVEKATGYLSSLPIICWQDGTFRPFFLLPPLASRVVQWPFAAGGIFESCRSRSSGMIRRNASSAAP